MFKHCLLYIVSLLLFKLAFAQTTSPEATSDWRLALDVNATHSGLTTYKGSSDDLSANIKFKYKNIFAVPMIRASRNSYNYLNETIPGNTNYSYNKRDAFGLGVDFFLNKYLRFRYLHDWITNKTDSADYEQDSYLIIYNQYLDLNIFELNNYLESVLIPRYSNKLNTFVRTQALKSFILTRTADTSHTIYPFVQIKLKSNDEEFFGKSGSNASLGAGYKLYSSIDQNSTLAFLAEGHSLVYQSADFNADWFQSLVVLQYTYR